MLKIVYFYQAPLLRIAEGTASPFITSRPMTTVKAAFFSLSTTIQMIVTSRFVFRYWWTRTIQTAPSKWCTISSLPTRTDRSVFPFLKQRVKLCIIAEFFTLHIPLALCPFWSILWSNECCIPSIDFWTTLPLVWTTNAIIAIKRNLTLPCRFSIALPYRFVPCSTSQKYCSVIIKSEIS